MKISITRALSELKLLDARITKGVSQLRPAAVVKKGAGVPEYESRDAFINEQTAAIQSVRDLIQRSIDIKEAIMASNATNKIKIGDREMTVADAIARKNNAIPHQLAMLQQLNSELNKATRVVEMKNSSEEEKAHDQVSKILNSQDKASEKYKEMIQQYLDVHEFELVAPKNLRTTLEKSISDVEEFMNNVDYVLSENNATTMIEIPD